MQYWIDDDVIGDAIVCDCGTHVATTKLDNENLNDLLGAWNLLRSFRFAVNKFLLQFISKYLLCDLISGRANDYKYFGLVAASSTVRIDEYASRVFGLLLFTHTLTHT